MRQMRKCACGVVLLLAVPGCDTDWGYALTAVTGQLDLLQNTIPIDQAVAILDLTDEQRSKLELIQDVRLFARDRVGLNIENYYTTYYDAGDRPVEIAISYRHVTRDGWHEAEQTLLHEMIHQWQAESGRPVDHGAMFRQKAREVGVTPRAMRDVGRSPKVYKD